MTKKLSDKPSQSAVKKREGTSFFRLLIYVNCSPLTQGGLAATKKVIEKIEGVRSAQECEHIHPLMSLPIFPHVQALWTPILLACSPFE